jgi:toxin ParE1/3/4
MNRYALTPRARQDLEEIQDYIAQSSVRAATRLIDAIEDKCRLLAQFPEMAPLCEEYAVGLRNSSVGKYVIFYRVIPNGIEVIRVLHGARDLPPLLEP